MSFMSCALQVVIMADGQVTQGSEIVKPNVRKVRRINDDVIGGFAGSALACHAALANGTLVAVLINESTSRCALHCPQALRQTRSRCSSGWR